MQQRPEFIRPATIGRVAAQARINRTNMLLMGVSGVLAAVALLTNSVPLLVGSMVVAPTLAPFTLVAFAAVGRQPRLAMYGLLSGLTGLLVAGLIATGTTWLLNQTYVIPPETNLVDKPLLFERLHPGWYTVITAFAAGVAGAVAMTKDKLDTLVGVIAALALVPAVAAFGISLLSGEWQLALGGLLMAAGNGALIVLGSVVTLLVVRPDRDYA